jgi:hypothetical protein
MQMFRTMCWWIDPHELTRIARRKPSVRNAVVWLEVYVVESWRALRVMPATDFHELACAGFCAGCSFGEFLRW